MPMSNYIDVALYGMQQAAQARKLANQRLELVITSEQMNLTVVVATATGEALYKALQRIFEQPGYGISLSDSVTEQVDSVTGEVRLL